MSKKSWVRTIYERLKYSFTELKILQNYKKNMHECIQFTAPDTTYTLYMHAEGEIEQKRKFGLVWQ